MQQVIVSQKEKSKFYVYVYLDPRKPGQYKYNQFQFQYQPFYIGKGQHSRKEDHLFQSYNKRDITQNHPCGNHKCNKIRKIKLVTGNDPIIIQYKSNMLQMDALNLQKKLIKEIGRIDLKTGPLTNLTAGGEFFEELIRTQQHCNKISISLSKYVKTPQHCDNLSKARKGCVSNRKGVKLTPQIIQKQKISRGPMDDQYIQKIKDGFTDEKRKQAGQRSRQWHARTRDERIKQNKIVRNEYLTKTFGLFIEQINGRAFVKDINTNKIVMSSEGYTCFAAALKITKRRYNKRKQF